MILATSISGSVLATSISGSVLATSISGSVLATISYSALFRYTIGCNDLSYCEVDHWMWRLFLSDLTSACSVAGLPADHTRVASIPLLYGISDCVLPRQPYWPASVHLCGYWQLQQQWLPSLSDDLVVMVSGLPSPVLYVGFGSMEHYLTTDQWLHAITIIDTG